MKLINFLVCDDIRVEIGNKHSIIGLYDDAINFSVPVEKKDSWPKTMKLGIFVRAQFDDEKELETIKSFQLEATLTGHKNTIAKGALNLNEKRKAKGINLAAVFEPFAFENSGDMELKLILFNEKNEIVATLERPEKLSILENVRKQQK